MITDLIGLVLVLVILVGIITLMVRGPKSRGGGAGPSADISGWGAFPSGALSAAAVGASVVGLGGGWPAGLTIGAVLALVFAPLAGPGEGRRLAVGVLQALFGVVGFTVWIGEMFSGGGCVPTSLGQQLLVFGLVLVGLVLGGLLSFWRGFFRPATIGATILAAYGALEVVGFLSSPIGVSLFSLGWSAWVFSIVAAFAFGFAASFWPELMIGIAGIVVVVGTVLGSLLGSGTCVQGIDVTILAPIVSFVIVYALVRSLFGRFLGS